jgi:membrane fusion protein (multidrug efflux system)
VAEGQAKVDNAQATLQQAQIDLGYTRIASPIDGRIGRALITKGNLVSPSSGPLATVIQIDPIRVVIAMPDAEYMTAFERYSIDTNFNPLIKVRLANGTVLSDEGEIAFDDNQMDRATGTMAVRLRFPNPNRMLVPNAYVNALVQDRNAPQRILLPVEAVLHGEGGTFVWAVKDDNTVEQVMVTVGTQIGERQIIESGLEPGQRVVYAGMQKIRPGMAVSPIEAKKSE